MWVERKLTITGSMGDQWCTGVFKLINKENFDMKL